MRTGAGLIAEKSISCRGRSAALASSPYIFVSFASLFVYTPGFSCFFCLAMHQAPGRSKCQALSCRQTAANEFTLLIHLQNAGSLAAARGTTTYPMPIPTEPIGSLPRPPELVNALDGFERGVVSVEKLAEISDSAVRDTIRKFEETGSPVITDGEQLKPSFATYPVHGMSNISSGGVVIEFSDGHHRQLSRLVKGPFRYQQYADRYVKAALNLTSLPVKQAVISASALSLLYQEEIPGYSNERFVEDLIREAKCDIQRCLAAGAHCVQIDFTEARLSLKLDPSGGLLRRFIELNNLVLAGFCEKDKARIGIHSCPGGDLDATHSASVDYELLIPSLFTLNAGQFYVQLASEPDRARVLRLIQVHAKRGQIVFVGVIDPIDPQVESAEEVRERVLEAASYLRIDQLGTTDDCGFAPFADDLSTSRDVAFRKIAARVAGTRLAECALGMA